MGQVVVNYKHGLYSDCNPDCARTVPRLCTDRADWCRWFVQGRSF